MKQSLIFAPGLAALIESRTTCLAISGSLGLHFALVFAGLPGWQCPLRYSLGIPCPGCGLSRSINALFQGDLQSMVEVHAFAPVAVGAVSLIVAAAVLPEPRRTGLIQRVAAVEQQSGITIWVLILFLGYWLVRLLFFHENLYRLVM